MQVGLYDSDSSPGTRVFVQDQVKHPDFQQIGSNALTNDVMLLYLDRRLDSAPLARINSNPAVPADGEMLTVIGTGAAYEDGPPKQRLNEVNVPQVPYETCLSWIGASIDDRYVHYLYRIELSYCIHSLGSLAFQSVYLTR